MAPSDVLLRKLQYHSTIDSADVAAIRRLRFEIRELAAGEEFIRQGDRPKAAAIVIEGIMARYHTLQSGARQYLALHYPGDWPDAQGLFLEHMDHSICAVGGALVCSVSHEQLMKTFAERPTIRFAVWRETLIDAAIFRGKHHKQQQPSWHGAGRAFLLRAILQSQIRRAPWNPTLVRYHSRKLSSARCSECLW